MSLDLIKEGSNGQLEFDFDALAAKTNDYVAARVKQHLKGYDLAKFEILDDSNGFFQFALQTKFRSDNLAMNFLYTWSSVTNTFYYSCWVMGVDREWKHVHDVEFPLF